MRFSNETAISAADAAQPTQASNAIAAAYVMAASAQCVLSGAGSNVGTVKLQASNDSPISGAAPTHWSDVTSASVTFAANGTMLIPKTELCYQWIRFLFTNTAGSGVNTITVQVQSWGQS